MRRGAASIYLFLVFVLLLTTQHFCTSSHGQSILDANMRISNWDKFAETVDLQLWMMSITIQMGDDFNERLDDEFLARNDGNLRRNVKD